MKVASLKNKINRILSKSRFQKKTSTKSRVKGLQNVSAGYEFGKLWDDIYLRWSYGNMAFRGKSNEEHDIKTMEIYRYLCEQGLENDLELSKFQDKVAIILKGEK